MEIITLKSIAEKLGISVSTVSRALKNHPDISALTKNRVNELASFLEYEPNLYAINLRSKNHRVLGLVVSHISGYFYGSFLSAIEEECRKEDYRLMILQSGSDVQVESKNLSICRQNRISGLFACLASSKSTTPDFDKVIAANIPLVFFDKVPDEPHYNKVCVQDEEASAKAGNIIMETGRKNILAIFGEEYLSISKNRSKALDAVISKHPHALLTKAFCSTAEEAQRVIQKCIKNKKIPDAVYCMSDQILQGVMKALQHAAIAIPDTTAVIALSDGYLPKVYTPEVTYIETSGYKLGKLAFKRMMECIAGDVSTNTLFVKSVLVKGKTI